MRRQIETAVKIRRNPLFSIFGMPGRIFFESCPNLLHSCRPRSCTVFRETGKLRADAWTMGFYLSIPGVVTFPKAESLHEVVRRAPLDRLLVETDSPYLAPIPYRGKTNEPAFILHTARKIAECRKEPFEKVAEQTTEKCAGGF